MHERASSRPSRRRALRPRRLAAARPATHGARDAGGVSLGQRLGVLGGTFDPIHNGHIQLAKIARAALGLDRVLLIPAGAPPLKLRSSATAADRLRMVELVCDTEPGLECCDIEIHRSGPSYTVDTLRKLRAVYPDAEIWFLLGRDALADFDRWREPEVVFELSCLAVIARAGDPTLTCLRDALPGALGDRFTRAQDRMGPDGVARREWQHASGRAVIAIEVEPDPISSSAIRSDLAHGETRAEWLPPVVAQYIALNGLYRDPDATLHADRDLRESRLRDRESVARAGAADDVARGGAREPNHERERRAHHKRAGEDV
jgi:nicotinate-nucleotide adenylyltransferase